MIGDVVEFFKANSDDIYTAIKPHSYPFVEYREIREAHVNRIYFKGDKHLPEFVGKGLRDESTFLIGIAEWIDGQDHRQLGEFVENAGFNFILRAEGREEIVITRDNYRGNSSAGHGDYQAFYTTLTDDQLEALVPNLPYTIEPVNKSKEYFWTVNEGVRLIRPINYDDLILAALNNTIQAGISFNCSVESAIGLLDQLAIEIDYEGTRQKIRFKANLERSSGTPKIVFWAKGLSTMEVLMVICHRADLEYRIEGTTVYVENK